MRLKAIANLDVAEELINKRDEEYSTISIHCSYYAVLQYMKYTLATTKENPILYKDQNNRSDKKGSHDTIIMEIQKRIKDRHKAKDFAEEVRLLKKKRVEADYSSKRFSIDESLSCKENADSLINKLKCFFEL